MSQTHNLRVFLRSQQQNVIAYYDQQTEDEAVADAEAAMQNEFSTMMAIPTELVPIVLELIDKHIAKKCHNVERSL